MLQKKTIESQTTFWISTDELQVKPQITFYANLNAILEHMALGEQLRTLCRPYYSEKANCRPPLDPLVYFKMLFVGFFENIKSERAIASRCADSLSIRSFLGYSLIESTPDHSTLSVIRKRLPDTIYSQVFTLVLSELKSKGLVVGKNIALDTSVMEANASLSTLENRMTHESYRSYVRNLAEQAGVDPTDPAAVSRFDRKRPDRKTSNKEWLNPHDPDAKIGQTKDGATDMIYKPEHVVDLDTGAIIDADILFGDRGDTHDLTERIDAAQVRLLDISDNPVEEALIATVTMDKGYYNVQRLTEIQSRGILTIVSDKEFKRNMSKLTPEEEVAVKIAQCLVKSPAGKELLKRRGMHVERSFAHVLDCGGERETTLRGIENIRKRYLIATACYNLSLLMRTVFGFGTPKQLFDSLVCLYYLLGCFTKEKLKQIYSFIGIISSTIFSKYLSIAPIKFVALQ